MDNLLSKIALLTSIEKLTYKRSLLFHFLAMTIGDDQFEDFYALDDIVRDKTRQFLIE